MMNTIDLVAPFPMPAINIKDFAAAPRFSIIDFGAEPENQQNTDKAIALAINAASASGAGVVVIPGGHWRCAAIHFKSNVNVHLDKGAVLQFSADPADYLPAVKTSWEGIECYNYSPLIYAYECENIALTGEGQIQASLEVWRTWFERPKPHMDAIVALYQKAAAGLPIDERQMAYEGANLRPHFVHFNRCRHVLIEDVRIKNSPFWVLHPYLCQDVVVRRVNIEAHGHNNDGVDPEMTQNMLIEDCVFDQGDDAISVKAGRDHDGWHWNTPSKNIVMRNCRIKNGHHLLALGSELSGGIENIYIDNCHFDYQPSDNEKYVEAMPDAQGFGNLMYLKTNAYRGGYVKNIYMNNCSAKKLGGSVLAIETDVLYQWRTLMTDYEQRRTNISGIFLTKLRVDEAQSLTKIDGDPKMPVKDVYLKDIELAKMHEEAFTNRHVESFNIE